MARRDPEDFAAFNVNEIQQLKTLLEEHEIKIQEIALDHQARISSMTANPLNRFKKWDNENLLVLREISDLKGLIIEFPNREIHVVQGSRQPKTIDCSDNPCVLIEINDNLYARVYACEVHKDRKVAKVKILGWVEND